MTFIGTSTQKKYLYLTASDAGAPFIDVQDFTVDSEEQMIPKVRLGNLSGIVDSDYSNSDNEGQIMAKFRCKHNFEIKQADAFLQGIVNIFAVSKEELNEELPERNGGFGSTDRK